MARVAIYARVSTRLQKIRQTSEAQVQACRALVDWREARLLGVFVDEVVQGSTALEERPSGRRLLQLCATGAVNALVVSRLDRISRNSVALRGVLETFARLNIEIWSLSEGQVDPRSVTTEVARSIDFAEVERSVVSDRMAIGRDRAVSLGKWVGGPVPFGYDLDESGRLTPSRRLLSGESEADVARSVFMALANGSSTIAEARRLQQLGALPGRRYSTSLVLNGSGRWLPSRINSMVRNPLYAGTYEFASRMGMITREIPGLVSREIWLAAQQRLAVNRSAKEEPPHEYLLRGLIFCDACGCRFAGTPVASGTWRDFYYRCAGHLGVMYPAVEDRCQAKSLPAEWIETWALRECMARNSAAVDIDTFADRRALVETQIARISVRTIGSGRQKVARVTITFRDGGSVTDQLSRRPRRSREH